MRISNDVVSIPDVGLNQALHDATGVPIGTDLTSDDLAALTSLSASRYNIASLTGMEHCVNLVDVDFSVNAITDLSPLSALTTLGIVNVAANRTLSNQGMDPISNLPNITTLNIGSTNIFNIDFISQYRKLTELQTGTCYQLFNIAALSEISSLITLDINNCSKIRSITPLSQLKNLTYLNLSANIHIDNIASVIPKLVDLQKLYLETVPLTNLDFITGLHALTDLDISGCSISDLTPLSGLNALSWLSAKQNRIYDMSPLVNLTNLENLYLAANYLTAIPDLASLKKLVRFDASSNFITDISYAIRLVTAGVNVSFQDNFIYGRPGQRAFSVDGDLSIKVGEQKTVPFILADTLDGTTYEPQEVNVGLEIQYYAVFSADSAVAFISTQTLDTVDVGLTIQTEVQGVSAGATTLSVNFSPAPGFSNVLPLTTGNTQLPVAVTE